MSDRNHDRGVFKHSRFAITLALVAVVYVLAGRLGLLFAVVNPSVTAIWPAAGVAVAALLVIGPRAWPALVLAAFVTNVITLQAILPSAGIAAGNTLEYVFAAALARRFARGRLAFERGPDILRFTALSALVAPTVAATVGVSTLYAFERTTWASTSMVWFTWWLGDATGIMLFAPLCVLWAARKPKVGSRSRTEAVVFGTTVIAVLFIVFVVSADAVRNTPLAVLMVPILLWSAFRFALRTTALMSVVLSAIAVYRIRHEFGPFLLGAPSVSLLIVQALVSLISLLVLSAAAEASSRRRGENKLRLLNRRLERRVTNRTAELGHTQERLLEAQALGHVGSWEWDLIHETMWWSGEMCRMFGLTVAPRTLEGFLTFVHPDDRARVAANFQIGERMPRRFSLEYRIIKADGETRVLHGEGRLEVDSFGRLSRIIGVCHDISDQKKAEEERTQLLAEQTRRREFEEIDRAKDTFLATLSHELRTPLNVALGWAAVLRDSPPLGNVQRARAIDSIYRNLMLQWRLVSDILDLSQIVKGTLVLDSKPVDLSRVFEAAIEMLRETARDKGVAFDIRISGPSIVLGDSRRLEQVAWNLVSNAIKFAAANGRVMVSVRESQDMVECTVEDDGGGISQAFLPHIFERFRQADREHGGLGLGMAIAHDIVTMHQGTISAGNRAPHGAVFVVRLPGYSPSRTASAAVGPRSNGNHNEHLTDE